MILLFQATCDDCKRELPPAMLVEVDGKSVCPDCHDNLSGVIRDENLEIEEINNGSPLAG